MRNLHELLRDTQLHCQQRGPDGGSFLVKSPVDKGTMKVIASFGLGWDHVSVSRPTKCPNWPEMDFVRRLFFKDNETVMQLHVPVGEHISYHPYCLHLWRPHGVEIPRPPNELVGAP
jgi:hypothetical protein